MKKLIALVLALVMVFSCAVVASSAQISKIPSQLQEVMDRKAPDDLIAIYVWTNTKHPTARDMPAWPDRGLANDQLEEYFTNWYNTEIAPVVFEGIEYEEITIVNDIVLVYVKNRDIEKIASHDIVKELAYSDVHTEYIEEKDPYEEKLHPFLKYMIDNFSPDDVYEVYVWFSGDDISISDMELWPDFEGAKAQLVEYYTECNAQSETEAFDGIEYEKMMTSRTSPYVVVSISASAINTLITRDAVEQVCLRQGGVVNAEHNDMFLFEGKYRDYLSMPYEYEYDELFYHFDDNNELDWVLLNANSLLCATAVIEMDFGNRLITSGGIYHNFKYTYGVYDVKEDVFYDLYDLRAEPQKYDGLLDALDQLDIGREFGDCNNDGNITILDATFIQSSLAKIDGFNCNDRYYVYESEDNGFVCDFNRDGEVSVMDATSIQHQLAKLSN